LEYFIKAPKRVLSRENLHRKLRGDELDVFDRSIDIQVGRLRKKLGDDPSQPKYIKTVRGVGYMFIKETSTLPDSENFA